MAIMAYYAKDVTDMYDDDKNTEDQTDKEDPTRAHMYNGVRISTNDHMALYNSKSGENKKLIGESGDADTKIKVPSG